MQAQFGILKVGLSMQRTVKQITLYYGDINLFSTTDYVTMSGITPARDVETII